MPASLRAGSSNTAVASPGALPLGYSEEPSRGAGRPGKRLAAESNPQRLKRGIECGLPLVAHHLRSQAWRIEEPAEIVRLAEGMVGEVRIAEMLGEIVDSVGPDGAVLVENAEATETGYAYVD